jgi:hypothetical protein
MSTLATTAPSPGYLPAMSLPLSSSMDPQSRNLGLAIGASLLLHGILLSIHFAFPDALSHAKERALDVILVNSRSATRPTNVQAKAQANLDGGGNTDEDRRAATPLPVSRQTKDGESLVEAQRRVAQLAGDVDIVARPRPGTQQRPPGRHIAQDRHAEIARTLRGVAADEFHAEALREREEAAREGREERRVAVGKRAGEQREARTRAHRRHVRQVDRERLVAEALRIGAGQEVPALHQHVDRRHEFEGRVDAQHRTVVAHPHPHVRIARRAPEETIDQRELVHGGLRRELGGQDGASPRRAAAISAPRAVIASLSSTPFTYRWPSVPP